MHVLTAFSRNSGYIIRWLSHSLLLMKYPLKTVVRFHYSKQLFAEESLHNHPNTYRLPNMPSTASNCLTSSRFFFASLLASP